VLVTVYRRALFTKAVLAFCEHIVRTAYAELDVELGEGPDRRYTGRAGLGLKFKACAKKYSGHGRDGKP
jgi:hypothetical protein